MENHVSIIDEWRQGISTVSDRTTKRVEEVNSLLFKRLTDDEGRTTQALNNAAHAHARLDKLRTLGELARGPLWSFTDAAMLATEIRQSKEMLVFLIDRYPNSVFVKPLVRPSANDSAAFRAWERWFEQLRSHMRNLDQFVRDWRPVSLVDNDTRKL